MRFLGPKSVISDVEPGVVNPCLCEPLILMAYSVGIREPKTNGWIFVIENCQPKLGGKVLCMVNNSELEK